MAAALGLALSDAAWVGIGAPGSVDVDTGTVLYANNLEFDNVPLGQMIHERTGLPVYVDNDANVGRLGRVLRGCRQREQQHGHGHAGHPVSAAA